MSTQTDAAPEPLAPASAERVRVNKLDLLERLADDLAHEIKNPLHSMVINLEVLKRRAARLGGDGSEDLQRYAGVIATELERVNRRIELLLRLTRPARGAELTTLNEVMDELVELLQLEARHHEATLEYEPAPEPVRVRLARESGRQLILNLVLEALTGACEGTRLRISTATADGEALLRVECTGTGPAAAGAPAGDRLAVAQALAAAAGGRAGEVAPGSYLLALPLTGG